MVPEFLANTAIAAEKGEAKKDTVLVVIELTGGNDGLNTVVPFKNADYYKLRPNIAIAKDAGKKLTDDLALHPVMGEMAKLYTEQSAVCIVQGWLRLFLPYLVLEWFRPLSMRCASCALAGVAVAEGDADARLA